MIAISPEKAKELFSKGYKVIITGHGTLINAISSGHIEKLAMQGSQFHIEGYTSSCCICGKETLEGEFFSLVRESITNHELDSAPDVEFTFCEICGDKLKNIINSAPDGISCAYSELEEE